MGPGGENFELSGKEESQGDKKRREYPEGKRTAWNYIDHIVEKPEESNEKDLK